MKEAIERGVVTFSIASFLVNIGAVNVQQILEQEKAFAIREAYLDNKAYVLGKHKWIMPALWNTQPMPAFLMEALQRASSANLHNEEALENVIEDIFNSDPNPQKQKWDVITLIAEQANCSPFMDACKTSE